MNAWVDRKGALQEVLRLIKTGERVRDACEKVVSDPKFVNQGHLTERGFNLFLDLVQDNM